VTFGEKDIGAKAAHKILMSRFTMILIAHNIECYAQKLSVNSSCGKVEQSVDSETDCAELLPPAHLCLVPLGRKIWH